MFGKLNAPTDAMRRARYLTNSVQSVKIVLNSVNSGAPAAGLTTSVTSALTPASCPCTVTGPSVPPGSDAFTLTTYDAAGGTGNTISTATATQTITSGAANTVSITLNGIPASVTFGVPPATAGTAFGTAQTVTVAVMDADGGTILGAYSAPVTLADSDTSLATTLATSGTDNPGALQLLSSSDTATLAYSGLAIPPATISATFGGSPIGTNGTFTPTLQPIVFNPGATLSLTNTIGTATLNASEAGWTNAPFNQPLKVTVPANCSTVGTAGAGTNVTSTGTPINATVAATPSNGNCTLTVSDGNGASGSVTMSYTGGNSQSFTTPGTSTFMVPAGVTSITIVASGGQGGAGGGPIAPFTATGGAGGAGATLQATVTVTPGSSLTVNVGGQGGNLQVPTALLIPASTFPGITGGTNGGGSSGTITCTNGGCGVISGGSGGGASSVYSGATLLIMAGGGGGGGGTFQACNGAAGGAGGYPTGSDGGAGCSSGSGQGTGGTATAGGTGGAGGSNGTSGNGGAGAGYTDGNLAGGGGDVAGAGGGGGCFGGGGAEYQSNVNPFALGGAAGAGGGSSCAINTATGVSLTGTNTGNGSVTISW